jgi:hypothetical protein
MFKGQERRKYKRIEKPYMVRFRVKKYLGLEMPSADWDIVNVKNLSAGGILFFYNINLGFDSLLDLKIDVKSTLIINCVGKIIRIYRSPPTSTFGIAIKFIDIGEQEKEVISKALEEI